MILRNFLLLIVFLTGVYASAQCLSGDCKNGTGKMDFGYAVYEGPFKDGQPNGQGTMDYGDGEKYVGPFLAGKEEGEGVLYKGGKQTAVRYRRGVLQVHNASNVVGGNESTEKAPGCVTGNCRNGYGEMVFPSGNRFKGNFKDGQFSGPGEMQFAGGNLLKADFAAGVPQSGSFYYAAEKTLFKGTLNENGTPRSGVYESKDFDGVVTVSEGRIVKETHPIADSLRADHIANYQTCPACKGKGEMPCTSSTISFSDRQSYSAVSGFGVESTKTTTTYLTMVPCYLCGGTGESRKGKKRNYWLEASYK